MASAPGGRPGSPARIRLRSCASASLARSAPPHAYACAPPLQLFRHDSLPFPAPSLPSLLATQWPPRPPRCAPRAVLLPWHASHVAPHLNRARDRVTCPARSSSTHMRSANSAESPPPIRTARADSPPHGSPGTSRTCRCTLLAHPPPCADPVPPCPAPADPSFLLLGLPRAPSLSAAEDSRPTGVRAWKAMGGGCRKAGGQVGSLARGCCELAARPKRRWRCVFACFCLCSACTHSRT